MVQLFANKETSEEPALLSPWSVPHFLVGMAAKERGIPFWWFELGHLMYELKDQAANLTGESQNTLLNSVGDQAVATVGHMVASTNHKSYVWTILYVVTWLGAVALDDQIG